MAIDEGELVRRFQRREAGAFDELYALYGTRLYRFCYRLCGHVADAEDLTQEAFVAAYQGLDRFAGRSSLTTWLHRIALYRWRRLFGARRLEIVPLEEQPDGAATTPDPASGQIERLSLENAIAHLPEPLREAFLLVKVEGLKYREAARALDVPQGTVQSRVHDAVMQLRTLLAAEGDAPTTCGCRGNHRSVGRRTRHEV